MYPFSIFLLPFQIHDYHFEKYKPLQWKELVAMFSKQTQLNFFIKIKSMKPMTQDQNVFHQK